MNMKIRIRDAMLTVLVITLLITPTNKIHADKNEANSLHISWNINNVKLYTNDDERVCLYDPKSIGPPPLPPWLLPGYDNCYP